MQDVQERKEALVVEKEKLIKEKQQVDLETEKVEKENAILKTEVGEVEALQGEVDELRNQLQGATKRYAEVKKEQDEIVAGIHAKSEGLETATEAQKSDDSVSFVSEPDTQTTPPTENALQGVSEDIDESHRVAAQEAGKASAKMTLDEMQAALKAARPDNLSVSVNYPESVNDLRHEQNQQSHIVNNPDAYLPILAENQAEIRVETPNEQEKFYPIAGSDGVVNPNQSNPVTYESAIAYMEDYIETGKLYGKEVIVYDSIGFIDRFADRIDIVEKREHEYYRTEQGVKELEDKLTDEHEIPDYKLGFWQVFVPVKDIVLNGESFLAQWQQAYDTGEENSKASLMKELRASINVEYLSGEYPPESEGKPIRHAQILGDLEDYQINVVAGHGQRVRIFRDDTFPESTRVGDYHMYNDDDTHSPANAGFGECVIDKG